MSELKASSAADLLAFLIENHPSTPRTRVKKWLRLGCVSVNGKPVTRHDHTLKAGDKVRIEQGKKTFSSPVRILHHDEHILVADKPAGLLTVSTEKEKTKTLYFQLNEWLKADAKNKSRVFIVHRLDRETSGLLVFAKTEEAKRKLQKEWETAEKRYIAVVEGTPERKEDTLRSHLAQNSVMKMYSTEKSGDTKLAVTHYRTVSSDGRFSQLEVSPKTGRKNQIRVQLADIGHPVAGDEKYGAKTDPAARLALHAWKLSIRHPETGKKLSFESPLPVNLSRIVRPS